MCVTINVRQVRYVCYYKRLSGTLCVLLLTFVRYAMCVTINVRQVRYVCYYKRSSGAQYVLL